MLGSRAQQSGLGGGGACPLSALLWLSLLLQHVQTTEPTDNTQGTTPTPSLSEVCGRTKFQGKIYGGQTAGSERWPWQASLRLYGRHICGAVLIDKNWVAGAAHCFQRSHNPADYEIRLGYTRQSSPTEYSVHMSVYKLFVHKDYDKFYPQGSDIALMQLSSPVEFSSHILPACVPKNDTKIPANKPCWTSGWGHLREDKLLPLPDDLQEAELILMDNEVCRGFFPPPQNDIRKSYYIYSDMVCAADYEMEKSICRGDSGGPLVCLLNGAWYVVGLTSFSSSCEHPIASPSVFARVSYFENWIKENKEVSPDSVPQMPTSPPEKPKPPYRPRPPNIPRPPGGGTSSVNYKNHQGLAIKSTICTALLSSQVLLLQLI